MDRLTDAELFRLKDGDGENWYNKLALRELIAWRARAVDVLHKPGCEKMFGTMRAWIDGDVARRPCTCGLSSLRGDE